MISRGRCAAMPKPSDLCGHLASAAASSGASWCRATSAVPHGARSVATQTAAEPQPSARGALSMAWRRTVRRYSSAQAERALECGSSQRREGAKTACSSRMNGRRGLMERCAATGAKVRRRLWAVRRLQSPLQSPRLSPCSTTISSCSTSLLSTPPSALPSPNYHPLPHPLHAPLLFRLPSSGYFNGWRGY